MMKFRVYDKHLETIRDVSYIDFDNKEVMFYADAFEGNEDEASLDIIRRFNEVNIMRFTGKIDKNNKSIYEGDICRSYRRDFLGECEISWDHIELRWVAIKTSDESTKDLSDFDKGKLEVIGNIYDGVQ